MMGTSEEREGERALLRMAERTLEAARRGRMASSAISFDLFREILPIFLFGSSSTGSFQITAAANRHIIKLYGALSNSEYIGCTTAMVLKPDVSPSSYLL